jgi:hypothetical protein
VCPHALLALPRARVRAETWVWTKVQLDAATDGPDTLPLPRTGHVAATLGRTAMGALDALGEKGAAAAAARGPALLIHGGMTNDGALVGDTWILEPVFAAAAGAAD